MKLLQLTLQFLYHFIHLPPHFHLLLIIVFNPAKIFSLLLKIKLDYFAIKIMINNLIYNSSIKQNNHKKIFIQLYYTFFPQQCLYFNPLPQGQGSFLPIFFFFFPSSSPNPFLLTKGDFSI